MSEAKRCPFCGCSMQIEKRTYPNGDYAWHPVGWHEDECPLNEVLWCFDPEDGWTEEKVTEAWNGRDCSEYDN